MDVSEMLRRWQWFGEWRIGCVGILGDWVVKAVSKLCSTRTTTLTIEDLAKHALKPDQRLRFEAEARTRELKIEQTKAKSAQELQQLLRSTDVLLFPPIFSVPTVGYPLAQTSFTPLFFMVSLCLPTLLSPNLKVAFWPTRSGMARFYPFLENNQRKWSKSWPGLFERRHARGNS